MISHQQEDSLFSITVPIFCEWVFEKPNKSGAASSVYNYVSDLTENSATYLTTPQYSLPGFPGIKYGLNMYVEDKESLDLKFSVEMDYREYDFDGDFTCAITDCEPQHIIHNFNSLTDAESIMDFDLCSCLPEDCIGCPICIDKKIVFRVDGIFTVKKVETFWDLPFKVSDETRELGIEKVITTDFGIVVEEQEIQVHKSVLIENSTVFARMLDCDNWKETMENKMVIPDFLYEIVKFAIGTCYGELFNRFKEKEKYLMAFRFADKYDMEKFAQAVKKVIVFTPNNVVENSNFFFQNNAVELVDCAIDYILSCSQYSLLIKDIELLDAQIRAMFFDRVLISPVLKKDPKLENQSFVDETHLAY